MAPRRANLDDGPHAGPAQHGHLPRIDAVRPVLPRMVHADDAVYDGLVDALLRHPRAAQPEGSPSGGQRPQTCRRDKGDASSASARSSSGTGGRALPPGEPDGLRRSRVAARGPEGQAGSGAEPVPGPQRRGRRCNSEHRKPGGTAAAIALRTGALRAAMT